MKLPNLTLLTQSATHSGWKAEFPSAYARNGSVYRVTTYPDSDEIHVTSWVRNTRVVNARRIEQIRAGLRRF